MQGKAGKSRIGIRDIARIAGVSCATASRALRDQDLVTPETRALVRRVAGQMGYAPDMAARMLSTRRSRMIGLFTLMLSDFPFTDILRGVVSGAAMRGYGVSLVENPEEPQADPFQEMIRAVREGRVDGCLTYLRPEEAFRAADLSIPCLGVESYGVSTLPVVHIDGVAAGYDLTRHLLDLGHRRIALLGMDQPSMPLLVEGYRKALREGGLDVAPEWIHQYPSAQVIGVDGRTRDGYARVVDTGVRQVMAMAERPTAIIFHYTLRAMFGLQTFRRLGIRVPEDVAIVGLADEPGSDLCDPPITVWRGDYQALGRRSSELLIDQIEEETISPKETVLIPGTLVVRKSCGAAKG